MTGEIEPTKAGTGPGAAPRRARGRLLPTVLKLAFSLALLAGIVLLSGARLRDILRVMAGVRLDWIAVAFSLHAVGLLVSAWRWKILADAQGDVMSLGFLARSYLVGTFFGHFLPSSFGGDIVRIWDGSRGSGNRGRGSLIKSSAIVVVERATGVIVLFVFALAASLFRIRMVAEIPVIAVSLAVGTLGLAACAFFLSPLAGRALARLPGGKPLGSVRDKLAAFRNVILLYRDRKRPLALATAWAFVLQVNVIVYYFLIGRAFRLEIGLLDYFIFVPIVLLVQIIPVTINGLGVRELSYVAVFSYYGLSPEIALSFSLADAALRLVMGLAGGIVYVTRK